MISCSSFHVQGLSLFTNIFIYLSIYLSIYLYTYINTTSYGTVCREKVSVDAFLEVLLGAFGCCVLEEMTLSRAVLSVWGVLGVFGGVRPFCHRSHV